MRTHVARLTTGTVRYLEAGEGRPLVLLHGFPLSADLWRPQLADVPPGWRVIAPDLRGFRGASADPAAVQDTSTVTMAQYANDVLDLMTHLGIDRAVIGGLSMGGYVALALLREAATRVTALVLADTRATADSDEGRAARDRMIALVERDGPEGVAREMMPKLLGPTSHSERPGVVAAVERLITSNTAPGVRAALQAMKARPDSTGLLANVTCPTLVVCGAEDLLTPPADSEAIHRAIAGSRLVLLPRAGHLSNIEDASGFNLALKEFLS